MQAVLALRVITFMQMQFADSDTSPYCSVRGVYGAKLHFWSFSKAINWDSPHKDAVTQSHFKCELQDAPQLKQAVSCPESLSI